VERYEQALSYLRKNIVRNELTDRVQALEGDVLQSPDKEEISMVDAILSNPPYIVSDEIPTLQPEVQQEPIEALDGGKDGMTFYRAIVKLWLPMLKPGGLLAVEVGEGQSRAVGDLFEKAGLEQVQYAQDFSGIERVVYGTAARK
jgi:release factor glutamine methyltransferase